jgi:hypothetical protein
MTGVIIALSCSAMHTFSKPVQNSIRLVTGLGVEDDAHMGETIQSEAITFLGSYDS